MSKQAETQRGRRKNRSQPAIDYLQKANNAKREYLDRIARARAERQRMVERLRSEESAKLIAVARAERAKRIAAGIPVAPTIDEWREGRRATFTVSGDLA
jgi:hypothetical protein